MYYSQFSKDQIQSTKTLSEFHQAYKFTLLLNTSVNRKKIFISANTYISN